LSSILLLGIIGVSLGKYDVGGWAIRLISKELL